MKTASQYKKPSICGPLGQNQDLFSNAKRRVYELLKSQGMQPRQQITFLSDGGDTARELQAYLNPESEHLLDWFYITMRITVMMNLAKGLPMKRIEEMLRFIEVFLALDRLKWYLWHGNVIYALLTADSLIDLLMYDESDKEKPPHKNAEKRIKVLEDMINYIMNNAGNTPNYGERYRYGERISTGFVESTVNQVVSKRFVKKQQMQWTRRGVHLLLQVRTDVLNSELYSTFQQWFPNFRQITSEEKNWQHSTPNFLTLSILNPLVILCDSAYKRVLFRETTGISSLSSRPARTLSGKAEV